MQRSNGLGRNHKYTTQHNDTSTQLAGLFAVRLARAMHACGQDFRQEQLSTRASACSHGGVFMFMRWALGVRVKHLRCNEILAVHMHLRTPYVYTREFCDNTIRVSLLTCTLPLKHSRDLLLNIRVVDVSLHSVEYSFESPNCIVRPWTHRPWTHRRTDRER